MQRSQSSLGIIGVVTLFFGGAAYAITQDAGLFAIANILVGIVFLIAWAASTRGNIGTFFGERSTKFGANAALYSLLFVGILIMANFLSARHFKRWDATEAGVFSLSPMSINYVKELTQDIELQGFAETGKDPALLELFKSYAAESSHVKYKLIDPDKNPDLAQKYAITNYGTIRVAFGEQSTLVNKPDEESVTNAIVKVTHSTKKTLCLIEGHGEPEGSDVEKPKAYGQLRLALENENFTVNALLLATQGKVPDECSMVIVPAPEKAYLDSEIASLRSYMQAGGRALFLLAAQKGPELSTLLADFGIKVGNDIVVDQVVRLFQGPALGVEPLVQNYGRHPITGDFKERTIFPFARSVEPVAEPQEGIEVAPLATTSNSSWAESDLDALFNKSQATLDPKTDKKGPISIAVAAAIHRKEGDKDISSRLVVFGSAQFVGNKFLNQLFNRDLMLNAVNWTVGEDKQISIRARAVRASRIQLTSEQVTKIFYLSVLILPELLLLLGIAVWSRRRSL